MNHSKKKDSGSKSNKDNSKFHSKNIKHDPSAESARAVFGLNNTTKNKD
ncbi:CPC_1213 family protein [Oscillospiraceae bacterium LTW-04]|nr:CPC_1213 family protein [Oscillospiraceae bacterium MB24-C1]